MEDGVDWGNKRIGGVEDFSTEAVDMEPEIWNKNISATSGTSETGSPQMCHHWGENTYQCPGQCSWVPV